MLHVSGPMAIGLWPAITAFSDMSVSRRSTSRPLSRRHPAVATVSGWSDALAAGKTLGLKIRRSSQPVSMPFGFRDDVTASRDQPIRVGVPPDTPPTIRPRDDPKLAQSEIQNRATPAR